MKGILMNIQTSQPKSFWALYLNSALNNLETVIRFLNKRCAVTKAEKSESDSNGNIKWEELEKQSLFKTLRENGQEATKQRILKQLLKRLPFLNAIRETVEQATREQKKENENGKSITLDYWDIEQRQLTAENYADILEYYSKLLAELRNFFTHVDHNPVNFLVNSSINKTELHVKRYQLNILHVLTAALRETKRRFNYPAPQENNNIDELQHLRRYNGVEKCTESEYNAYQQRRKNGKLDLLEMPFFGNEQYGRYSKMKDNPNCRFFEKDKKNGEYVFTERGLAFFAAWFLQPDEIEKMFQKIAPTSFEKDRHSKQFLATKRTFGVFHIDLPKTRLENVEKMLPDTLGIDIISELHKTPSLVWNYLSREDQANIRKFTNKFNEVTELNSNTPENNNASTNNDDDKDNIDTDFSGRRIKNRFPYLVLSYFDLAEALGKIRFHLDWGNYVFDSYAKKTIDGSILPDRRLQKRIYSFERMQDAYKWFSENRYAEKTMYYETSSGEEPPKEFRVPMIPQYNISTKKNHIGITFETVPQPELIGKSTKRRKPDAFLNLSDLPALLFLAVHGQAEKAENILMDYRKNWQQFLQDIKDGKKISKNDLPKRGIVFNDLPSEFQHYIETGKSSTPKEQQQMKTKLKQILDETERDLKNFKDECRTDFKPGDKRKKRYKSGEIGSYLAHDLVKLQRPNPQKPHQGKITSVNFEALQAALATFSVSKGTLRDIFLKAGLIENPEYPHPFLNKLVDERGVKALTLQIFFRNYLEMKIEYIKNCQNDMNSTYLLDSLKRKAERKKQADYIPQLAETYLHEPLVLPKNLLDPLVEELVKNEFTEKYTLKEKETTKKGRKMNATFLMMRYHQWKFGDATQWFYTLPHGINSESLKKITNILKVKISGKTGKNTNYVGLSDKDQQRLYEQWTRITETERKGKKPVLITELNKIRKEFKKLCKGSVNVRGEKVDYREKFTQRANHLEKQEKKIPQLKLQDIVLFHAACKLLQIAGQTKLSDIQENKPYLLKQNERELSRTYNIPATSDRKEKKTLSVTITGKMKVKDSGNFNRMTNDPRVPSLLRLITKANGTNTVDYEHLREELAQFDRKRKEIFQWVHDLENDVRKKYPAEYAEKRKCAEKRKNSYTEFWSYLEVLVDKKQFSVGKALTLSQICNGFSHNYLPEFEYQDQENLSPKENAEAHKEFDQLRQQLIGQPLTQGESMVERILNIMFEKLN
jgi:hypothetical protein